MVRTTAFARTSATARRLAGIVTAAAIVLGGALAPAQASDDRAFAENARAEATQCLAMALYHEARGEPVAGQEAVGRVIMNRVDSDYHPDTVCGVVYKNAHMKNRCQFSFACDGISDRPKETKAWSKKLKLAEDLLDCGKTCREQQRAEGGISSSTHYHATYVNPRWAKKLKRTGKVGNHIFYWTATI